jgi:membrane-associated phospholipid phosphatase
VIDDVGATATAIAGRRPLVARALARLGPQGALAVVAVAVLVAVSASLGEQLHVPWDGIVPFLGIAGILLATSFVADLVARRRPSTRAPAPPAEAIERSRAAMPRAIALWAPFAIVYLCYRALRGAIPLLAGAGVEPQLLRADQAIFGVSPAWWFQHLQSPWLTEVMAYAYATMFFLPLAVLLVLYARRRDRALSEVALSLQLAFYLGFTIFLLVPARSPDIVYAFDTPLVGHGFYEMTAHAWRQLQAVTYDAFPSMHTAVSTLALVQAIRLRNELAPRHPWLPAALLAPVVILLQISTLYLRQHYFVDLIAGWGVAAVAITGAQLIAVAWPNAGPGSSPRQMPRASSQASNSGVGRLWRRRRSVGMS